jgi:hypothetical protein
MRSIVLASGAGAAVLGGLLAVPPGIAAQGPSTQDVNWAVCAFDVVANKRVSLLLFEPFPISADKDSFGSISRLFDDAVGVGSVLPGHEPHTGWTLNYRTIDECYVFASDDLAQRKFDTLSGLAGKGYAMVKTTEWRPSDEVTGLAKRSTKTEVATDAAEATEPEVDSAEVARKNREQRDAEWQAKVAAHEAEVADYRRKVAEREAEIARQQKQQAAAQDAAAREKAAYEAKMAAHRRELDDANQRQQEYFAAQRRHALCVGGDQKACADIAAGKPAMGEQLAEKEEASTDTDATRCVSSPVVGPSSANKGEIAATVINGCETAVDVRICLMREGGWNCGVTWGLQPQDRWSHTSFKSSGEIFWDARTASSNKPLASPEGM